MNKNRIDHELVAQAVAGDKAAFNALVIKYHLKIVKIVSRYTYRPNEILDLVQEVFIKAYRSLAKFRGESEFYTWLYRVAINTVKNHNIEIIRHPDGAVSLEQLEESEKNDKLIEDASPLQLMMRDEIQATIFKVLASLPDELRIPLTLRELDGLSYDEIAVVMQCPVGTIRSRLFRARELIEEKIKPLLDNQ